MKVISRIHTISHFSSKQFNQYFGGMRIGVFDIETLGLKPDTCPMVLAGFMTTDDEGNCTINQYFAETPEEENQILARLCEDFKKVDYLFTYNGKHFDIPFITRRAKLLGVQSPDENIYNLDLYLVLNGHSEIRYLLRNLKQKTVEIYMGLSDSRDDEISGAESIKLYKAYLEAIDLDEKNSLEEKILLHNHDDLLQLYQLMPILKQVHIHKAFYNLGFPIMGESGWPLLSISAIKTSTLGISIAGKYSGEKFSYISYDSFDKYYSCEFKEDGTFSFNIRVDKHKGNIFINLPYFFQDYEEFKVYPNYIKNFLLVSNNNNLSYLELNMFIKKFMLKFMEDNICPTAIL